MYLDAFKAFPKGDLKLRTEKGNAVHIKTDVFKKEMWYAYDGDGGGLVSLKPDRVREIIRMNKEGKKPHDLKDFMEEVVVEAPDYSNVVGQDSLNRFEHIFKKKKKKPNNRNRAAGNKQNNPGNNSNKVEANKTVKNEAGTGEVKKKPNNKRRNNRNKPNNKPNNPTNNE